MNRVKIASLILAIVPSASKSCVLNIWPAEKLEGATAGSWMDGALMGAITQPGVDKNAASLQENLTIEMQNNLLKTINFGATLGKKGAEQIVFHTKPMKGEDRAQPQPSGCQNNFEIQRIIFATHPMYGKQLLPTFRYSSNIAARSFSSRYRIKIRQKLIVPADFEAAFDVALREGIEKFLAEIAHRTPASE